MIYKIKKNLWTDTYYVYRYSDCVELRKTCTVAMKKFMRTYKSKVEHNFEVWAKDDKCKN